MKRRQKKREKDSIWTRELIPEDSVWRRELIPEDSVWRKELIPQDSIWGKELFSFRRRCRCLQCPILMVEDERRCNRYHRIPDEIWNGSEECSLYRDA